MTYQQALEKINNRLRFGIKPGLTRINKLLEGLGNPHKMMRYVHVAGTNGKGSACTLISAALKENGYKTGLFISPYVLEFRERFQINGEMIPEDALIRSTEAVAKAAEAIEKTGDTVTEFEFITALAFHWFRESGCNVVVLEVGLGGKFDCTNVIDTPDVAVIMSIAMDHMAILGDSITAIASEKAGIIKTTGDVVVYPVQSEEAMQVLREKAGQEKARIISPDTKQIKIEKEDITGTVFRVGDTVLKTPFPGRHQVNNALTAYTAMQVLRSKGYRLQDDKIAKGFANAFIPARMEILCEEPPVLMDGGHNPECADALKRVIKQYLLGKKITAVMAVMEDKDVDGVLRILGPLFAEIITVPLVQPRTMQPELLAEKAKQYCPATAAGSPEAALSMALTTMQKEDKEEIALVVCGSFYLASDLRPLILNKFKN